MQILGSRRSFLAGLSAAGAAGFFGGGAAAAVEAPPETATVRLPKIPGTDCQAAEYAAGELLAAEGFTDVRFVETPNPDLLAGGDLDFDINFVPHHIKAIDTGVAAVMLTGLHTGCLELMAHESVRSVKDLKGKRVGVGNLDSQPHVLLKIMTGYIGLDPDADIEWVSDEKVTAIDLFKERKIDAFLAGPPEPQQLRALGVGHPVLSTLVDRPWSQYVCCFLSGSREYVANYPVATKRVLRAILKAADLCSSAPEWVARQMVEGGFAENYDYALQTLKDIYYPAWREFDPEDAVRFYAIRMHELGMLDKSPHDIIASNTDWSFLKEIKRELKA